MEETSAPRSKLGSSDLEKIAVEAKRQEVQVMIQRNRRFWEKRKGADRRDDASASQPLPDQAAPKHAAPGPLQCQRSDGMAASNLPKPSHITYSTASVSRMATPLRHFTGKRIVCESPPQRARSPLPCDRAVSAAPQPPSSRIVSLPQPQAEQAGHRASSPRWSLAQPRDSPNLAMLTETNDTSALKCWRFSTPRRRSEMPKQSSTRNKARSIRECDNQNMIPPVDLNANDDVTAVRPSGDIQVPELAVTSADTEVEVSEVSVACVSLEDLTVASITMEMQVPEVAAACVSLDDLTVASTTIEVKVPEVAAACASLGDLIVASTAMEEQVAEVTTAQVNLDLQRMQLAAMKHVDPEIKESRDSLQNQRDTLSESAVACECPPELWPTRAWAEWSCEQAKGRSDPDGAFEAFRTSCGVDEIAKCFSELCMAATDAAPPQEISSNTLDIIRAAVGSNRRLAATLWDHLQVRRSSPAYYDQSLATHRAVIVGAGPIGLRCALELKLLGAEVVVLEKRSVFDRVNRLHLWPWVGEDLKAWGAKIFEPPELSFGANPDFLHIGIAELQMLLLKSCLLLDVQVFFGAEYRGSEPQGTGWDIIVGQVSSMTPGPRAPQRMRGASILVGADGPRHGVSQAHELCLQETSTLRREAALGLVMNYKNQQAPAEKGRRSFSLARQFYEELFLKCERETGLSLENIVHYISAHTHYFVMTPSRQSLQATGILPGILAGETLSAVNEEALAQVARKIAAFPWKPEESKLSEETLDAPVGAPSLFDFSRMCRAAAGLRVVESALPNEGTTASKLLVGLCGDALIEPFWPEGLGIARGFFSALDLASAAQVWAMTGSATAAEAHFARAFGQLRSLSAKTRDAVLRADSKAYGLEPSTRYRFLSSDRLAHRNSVG